MPEIFGVIVRFAVSVSEGRRCTDKPKFRQWRGGQLTHGQHQPEHQRRNGSRQNHRGKVRTGIRPFRTHRKSRLNLPNNVCAIQGAEHAERQQHAADDLHGRRRRTRTGLIHAVRKRRGKRDHCHSADDQQRHDHVGRPVPLSRNHRQSDEYRIQPADHGNERTAYARHGA